MTGLVVAMVSGTGSVAAFVTPWVLVLASALSERFGPPSAVRIEMEETRATVGDTVRVHVTTTMATPCFVRVDTRPELRHRTAQGSGLMASTDMVAATARQPLHVQSSVTMADWGVWDLGRIMLHIESRFGLFEATGTFHAERTLRVHPSTTELRAMVAPRTVGQTTGAHRSPVAARGVEFAGMRPYTHGDTRRDIDWRASTRAQELIVAQRHPDRASTVVILIDSFIESNHDHSQVLTMAVQVAAAITRGHLGAADRVGFIEFGGLMRWLAPSSGHRHLHRLLDAVMESSLLANAADKELPRLGRGYMPPGCLVVALTPLLDSRFIAALDEARARGHDVAVIECEAFKEQVATVNNDVLAVSQRLRGAAHNASRDRLLSKKIAVATWHQGDHVEVALAALRRLRRPPVTRP